MLKNENGLPGITEQKANVNAECDKSITFLAYCQEALSLNEFELAEKISKYFAIAGFRFSGTSQVHIANWFAEIFNGLIYYVPELNSFYITENGKYVPDTAQKTQLAMKALILALATLTEYFYKFLNSAKISGCIELAKSCTKLQKSIYAFDNNSEALNCPDGCYSLRTGKRIENIPCMLRAGVVPDFEQQTPVFEKFITDVANGDEPLALYLKSRLAYSLILGNQEQTFSILYGTGSNGKSTLLRLMQYILGDYSATIAPETIMLDKSSNSRPMPELLALRGKRLIICSETSQESALNLQRIKSLTGGDRLVARPLFSNGLIEFSIGGQFFLQTNHLPALHAVDYAIKRRIRLLPFKAVFDEQTRDENLFSKLKDEAPGILAQLILLAARFLENGKLPECPAVTEAVKIYIANEDKISAFLETCTIENPKGKAESKALYAAYAAWCDRNGELPYSQNKFGRILTERGFSLSPDRHYRIGLILNDNKPDGDNFLPEHNEPEHNEPEHKTDTAPAVENGSLSNIGSIRQKITSGISKRCINCQLVKGCRLSAQRHGEACEGYQATTKVAGASLALRDDEASTPFAENIIIDNIDHKQAKKEYQQMVRDEVPRLNTEKELARLNYSEKNEDELFFEKLFSKPKEPDKKPSSAEIVAAVFGGTIISAEPLCRTCYHKTACRDVLEGRAQCEKYENVFQHEKRIKEQVTKTLAEREEAQNKIEQLF